MTGLTRTLSACSQQDVSSDESITDLTEEQESGRYDHTNSRRSPWSVHPLGHVTVKQGARARTSVLHQVKNLVPGKLRSVGLLLDGKCKVCTSVRCLHTSEYRKTCWKLGVRAQMLVNIQVASHLMCSVSSQIRPVNRHRPAK